jgi:hypothetical protein
MKLLIDTENFTDNEVAEMLRGKVFNQRISTWRGGQTRTIGCYSTFELNDEFIAADPEEWRNKFSDFYPDDEYWDGKVEAYESLTILAMWWWDGDGSLLIWPKGTAFAYVNHDCKCDYYWKRLPVSL